MSALPGAHDSDQAYDDFGRLEDYALIGNCQTAALVSTRGAIEWLCVPSFSGASIFASLLDRKAGGAWSICPAQTFHGRQSYVEGTNVLQTRFECDRGVVVLTDCFAIGANADGELSPQCEVLRIVECVEGEVAMSMRFAPRYPFGRVALKLRRIGSLGWQCIDGGMNAILQTNWKVESCERNAGLFAGAQLRKGETAVASWSYANREICVLAPLAHAQKRLARTVEWWRTWVSRCDYIGEYANEVRRSLLTLKLLTSSLTGAVVAAPTTSLPEEIGGARNWDYRFCWVRDSAFAMGAFLDLNYPAEATAFQRWLLRAVRLPWAKLQVVYDLWGNTYLKERELKNLRGYKNSAPVRIGNAASEQFQADLYGELIWTTAHFVSRGGALGLDERQFLKSLSQRIVKLWRDPDRGIWEQRSPPRHYTFSKAMCWVAFEQLLAIDKKLPLGLDENLLRSEQRALREQIESRGFNVKLGAYVSHYDSEEPDASLLLLARYGYVEPGDVKMRGTFALIENTLTTGPFVQRYRVDDGVSGKDNTFLPCAFWAVEYLALAGDVETAKSRLDRLIACSGSTGLLSEEYAIDSKQLLGNYPQALTHESLIAAALALDRAKHP